MIRFLATLISAGALAAGPALAQGGFLGVSLEPAPEGAQGALIAEVQERSAASIMGLRTGDLVTSVDGLAVADSPALSALIRSRQPGDIVELEVVRDGAAQKVLGVLARRPGAVTVRTPQGEDLGMLSLPGHGLGQFDLNQLKLDQFQQLQPRLQDLQLQLQNLDFNQDLLNQQLQLLHEQLPRFEFLQPDTRSRLGFRFDGEPGQILLEPGTPLKAGDGTTIQLRYPENTAPEERERLRQAAIEKYGPEVEVEFAGTGTSVTIRRQSTSSPEKAPASGGNREF